jgi:transposase
VAPEATPGRLRLRGYWLDGGVAPPRLGDAVGRVRLDTHDPTRGARGWATRGSALATRCCQTRTERKKRWIRRRIPQLPERSVILAEDETDLLLFPPLRSGWAPRGAQAKVWLTGRNASRVLFGAVNVRTGHLVLLCRMHQRAPDFCAFLHELRRRYRGRHVALLLDGDTSHTAKASQRLAAKLGITLLWLPTRSPHLNPMDHLWRDVKQNVCANRQDASIDRLVTRVIGHLQALSPRSVLRKAGVLSRRFWLRSALSKYFRRPT